MESKHAIESQVDVLIIVWAHKDDGYPNPPWLSEDSSTIFYYPGPRTEANISQWWNEGLNIAQDHLAFWGHKNSEWDVAIINDDAIVPEGWFDAVSTAMREHGAAAACSCGPRATQLFTEPGPIAGNSNPMEGFAFILAGEKGLRANEDIHWYFSDNYIDWESRKLGGMVAVSGWPVRHLHPNAQMGHDLIARVAVDAQNFVDLYGMRPW